ncbi:sulfotransferase [Planctomycetota bacterium]
MTKLAYILAASHSGSTLLSMLLGSHPQIATIGEINLSPRAMGDLDRYRCSCGEFIRQCQFWHKVKQGMAARGVAFDIADAGTDYGAVKSRYARRLLRPMHRGKFLESFRDVALGFSPAWRKELPQIHRRNAALAATISEITNADVIIDSSKIGLRLKYLLRNPELDVKVIRLLRDGRAVALTYMDPATFADAKDPNRRAGGMGGDRENQRLPVAQATYDWRRCVQEAEVILYSLDKSQWIEVRYEDYCKAPDAVLNRLQQFLGVEPGKQPKDFRAVEKHVIGNGMRLDTTSEIRLDERWRNKLTKHDLRVFDNVAGKTNRWYGYE